MGKNTLFSDIHWAIYLYLLLLSIRMHKDIFCHLTDTVFYFNENLKSELYVVPERIIRSGLAMGSAKLVARKHGMERIRN